MTLFVGTAGWSIPRAVAERFPGPGTHLERYARVLPAAEINTSFYRRHQRATYARWAGATPEAFRFAVKLPRTLTHGPTLAAAADLLKAFAEEISGLGSKLGPVLVQFPPSLRFDEPAAARFFADLRAVLTGDLVCEPRHPSWFEALAEGLLRAHRVARVAADPARVPAAGEPGGWPGLRYFRLHGSPRIYFSPYSDDRLAALDEQIRKEQTPVWCIFDNTASGAAAPNALALWQRLLK